jgi:hypothetical protein
MKKFAISVKYIMGNPLELRLVICKNTIQSVHKVPIYFLTVQIAN